jgi:hypothetical protein
VHVRPASVLVSVLAADVAAVSVSVSVAGAQESVPRSVVFVVAAAQFVLRLALNVPRSTGSPATTEPETVELVAAKVVALVPASFAKRTCP